MSTLKNGWIWKSKKSKQKKFGNTTSNKWFWKKSLLNILNNS